MRQVVRANFVAFTSPMEGVVEWMYADVKGLITTAIGNLIDPMQIALAIPWVHEDGTPADRAEIASEWMRVKSNPLAAKNGYLYAQRITNLRLTKGAVQLVVSKKLEQMGQYLDARFPEFEDWPACAQLAVLSQSWACGPAFAFPHLEANLRAQDWEQAAVNCTINETGNPGVHVRNLANKRLYLNAARVQSFHLDPDTLVWDRDLDVSEEVTSPGLDNPASSPTVFAGTTDEPDPDEAA